LCIFSIDINAIASELQALKKKMKSTDNAIADLYKKLEIETPF